MVDFGNKWGDNSLTCQKSFPSSHLTAGPSSLKMNSLIIMMVCLTGNQVAPAPVLVKKVDKLHFETDIRPILKAYCLDCHGGSANPKAGLDLRLKRFAVKGGKSGPVVLPGQHTKSLLWERMNQGEMPPSEKKVPPEQIALVERWINEGAMTNKPEPETLPTGFWISEEDRNWWAFVPLKKPELPKGIRVNPIDFLIEAKLKEKGLGFNPPASPRDLFIRAALDLTGIPPTFEQVQLFEADKDPNRWTLAIDKLLSSPAYGERWGRHWLDVVGYADSEGDGSADSPRDHAWRFRDWVIRSLNADMPLDRFVMEQLAGDDLVPKPWNNLTMPQKEILAATGFLRMIPGTSSAEGAEQVMTDTVKVFSAALLGVSVGCAQCHDHRYDPISQEDYFRIRAIVEPAVNPGAWRGPGQRLVSLYSDKDRAKATEVEAEVSKGLKKANDREVVLVKETVAKELQKQPDPLRGKLREALDAGEKRTAEQKDLLAKNPSLVISGGVLYQYNQPGADEVKKLRSEAEVKRATRPPEGFVMVLDETGAIPPTKLHYRGDPKQPKGDVLPGDLSVLSPDSKSVTIPIKGAGTQSSGRRMAYAKHLTSGTHPLFGRVMANRVWMHHFGKGLVDTPAEFGKLGQKPSHPELLDWLALELFNQKWSLKAIHRLILQSKTWQQTTTHTLLGDKADLNNALQHRHGVLRLDAEILRDRMLVAAGRLDSLAFGPPIPVIEHASGQILVPEDKPRRSIYLQQKRSKPIALMGAFDQPLNVILCEKRIVATNAPQSLMLLNGDFVHAQANHLAGVIWNVLEKGKAINSEGDILLDRAIGLAWQKILLRDPSPLERALSQELVKAQSPPGPVPGAKPGAKPGLPDKAALAHLTHQLLISNEFLHAP